MLSVFFRLVISATLLSVLASPALYAQTADDLSGVNVSTKSGQNLELNVDLGEELTAPQKNSIDLPTEWDRFAGGAWFGFMGQGIFGAISRFSSDKAFKDASEKGFGVGVQLDLGVAHSRLQAIRIRLGYAGLSITPDSKTLQEFSRQELESKLSVVHSQFMYRWLWKSFPDVGYLWFGAAVSANFVAKTKSYSDEATAKSALINTLGFGYQITAGLDYPIFKYTDLGAELAYHPFRSFSALLSLRTSL